MWTQFWINKHSYINLKAGIRIILEKIAFIKKHVFKQQGEKFWEHVLADFRIINENTKLLCVIMNRKLLIGNREEIRK
jgi:hypothetical protein